MPSHNPTPVVLSWSSGKDSAWALRLLRESGLYAVVALLTTVDAGTGCIPVHGASPEVLNAQAESIGLPLVTVPLEWPCSNAEYETAFAAGLNSCARDFKTSHIAFGDLFLEEIRAYRVTLCARLGWQPLFPLWGLDTKRLADAMCDQGLCAEVSCVNTDSIDAGYVERHFDRRWLAD